MIFLYPARVRIILFARKVYQYLKGQKYSVFLADTRIAQER